MDLGANMNGAAWFVLLAASTRFNPNDMRVFAKTVLIPLVGFGFAMAACSNDSNLASQDGMEGGADGGSGGSSGSSGSSSGAGASSGSGSSSGSTSSSGGGNSSGSGSSSGASSSRDGSTEGGTDGGTASADDFPHLGMISIGGPQQYAVTFEPFAAKVHVVIIGGNWEGWQTGRANDKETFISGVKAQSKVHTRIFQYVNLNEMAFARSGSWCPTFWDKMNSMNWWLYNAGTSGTKTPDWQDPTNKGLMNISPAAPKDPATGLGSMESGAKYVNDYYHLGQSAAYSAVPSLDGFFLDNVFVDPYVDGDWNLTGSSQSQKSAVAQAAVMAGEKAYFDYLKSVWPTGIQIGNSGDGIGQAVAAGWSVAGLDGVLQGGVLEGAIGKSYSVESWAGAAEMQSYYQSAMASMAAPKLLIFGHGNVSSTGSDPTAFSGSTPSSHSPAWQGMRNGLAATLMNDGYYFADAGSYDEETTANQLWFDEYDGAGAGVGYLGQPLSSAAGAAQTAAWTSGVWKREFAKGIVLWNPKGNGAKTVSLSGLGNLKHLKGSQNPTTNDGSMVTGGSVTLQDRDGLILLRY
jgi:hypothetical protein